MVSLSRINFAKSIRWASHPRAYLSKVKSLTIYTARVEHAGNVQFHQVKDLRNFSSNLEYHRVNLRLAIRPSASIPSTPSTPSSPSSPSSPSTRQNRGSRYLIRRPIPLRLPILIIDIQQNPRITLPIRTREANRRPSLASTAADVDLRTAHVELYALGLGGRVEGDDFGAEEVLAGLEVGWGVSIVM